MDNEINSESGICCKCGKILDKAFGVKLDNEGSYAGTEQEKEQSRIVSYFINLVGETKMLLEYFRTVYNSHTHSKEDFPTINDIESKKIITYHKVFETS